MEKKNIYYLLFVFIVFQSCSVYQKVPVPLSEACNKGKALIVDNQNKKIKSSKIERISGEYYATYKVSKKDKDGEYHWVEETIQIEEDKVKVYLSKDELTTSRIWVELTNKTKVTGILYDVTDSSILVIDESQSEAPLYKQNYIDQKYSMKEYLAEDIIKIKLRRKKRVAKTAGKGALIGAAIGYTFGFIVIAQGYGSLAAGLLFGTVGVIGAVPGAITGAIAGSPKEVYHINKNIYAFKSYQIEFQDKAVLSY